MPVVDAELPGVVFVFYKYYGRRSRARKWLHDVLREYFINFRLNDAAIGRRDMLRVSMNGCCVRVVNSMPH